MTVELHGAYSAWERRLSDALYELKDQEMAPRRGVGAVHTRILKSMKIVYIIFLLK